MNPFKFFARETGGLVERVDQIRGEAGADAIIHFEAGHTVQVPGLLVSYEDPSSSIVRSLDLIRVRTWIEPGLFSLTHCAEIDDVVTGATYYFENGGREYLELRRRWVD